MPIPSMIQGLPSDLLDSEKEFERRVKVSTEGGVSSIPFRLAVSMGLVDGYSFVDKYGENPAIDTGTDPEDIWGFGGVYIYDSSDDIISISSSSNLDTQDISIQGLDINGELITQVIALRGQTRVPLETPLWRCFRMFNDGDVDVEGAVYCYTGTANTNGVPPDVNVRAVINNGNNQTLMALYTIPTGKVGFLYRGELGASRSQTSGAARCAYYSRRFGKVFRIKKRVDITNQGTSVYQDARSFPDTIPSKTDIKLRVEEVTANNTGVFGTFDILLVDENKFPNEFLNKIGQPGY